MIAAAGSGSGKTTITCALLEALKSKGRRPTSAKCGPDYIDTMFHSSVLGAPSTNLDLFFFDVNTARYLLLETGSTLMLQLELITEPREFLFLLGKPKKKTLQSQT